MFIARRTRDESKASRKLLTYVNIILVIQSSASVPAISRLKEGIGVHSKVG